MSNISNRFMADRLLFSAVSPYRESFDYYQGFLVIPPNKYFGEL